MQKYFYYVPIYFSGKLGHQSESDKSSPCYQMEPMYFRLMGCLILGAYLILSYFPLPTREKSILQPQNPGKIFYKT